MAAPFITHYKSKHRHPLNRVAHLVGIPVIIGSVPLFFFSWRWALGLFVSGWVLQFAGHVIEGNQPAFFTNPVFLLVGPWWWVQRALEATGVRKQSHFKKKSVPPASASGSRTQF